MSSSLLTVIFYYFGVFLIFQEGNIRNVGDMHIITSLAKDNQVYQNSMGISHFFIFCQKFLGIDIDTSYIFLAYFVSPLLLFFGVYLFGKSRFQLEWRISGLLAYFVASLDLFAAFHIINTKQNIAMSFLLLFLSFNSKLNNRDTRTYFLRSILNLFFSVYLMYLHFITGIISVYIFLFEVQFSDLSSKNSGLILLGSFLILSIYPLILELFFSQNLFKFVYTLYFYNLYEYNISFEFIQLNNFVILENINLIITIFNLIVFPFNYLLSIFFRYIIKRITDLHIDKDINIFSLIIIIFGMLIWIVYSFLYIKTILSSYGNYINFFLSHFHQLIFIILVAIYFFKSENDVDIKVYFLKLAIGFTFTLILLSLLPYSPSYNLNNAERRFIDFLYFPMGIIAFYPFIHLFKLEDNKVKTLKLVLLGSFIILNLALGLTGPSI